MSKKNHTPEVADILWRVGDIIKNHRNEAIAKALGVAPTTASNWKNRGTIPWRELYVFAHRKKVSLDWLFDGKEASESDAGADADIASKSETARYREMIERYEWIIDNLRTGTK